MAAKKKVKEKAQYVYAAPYPGVVPGLPERITGAEARELGVEDVLLEALENGNYIEVGASEGEE